MKPNTIPPTIGRVVLFWPGERWLSHRGIGAVVIDHEHPFRADVCFLKDHDIEAPVLNLTVCDHVGMGWQAEDVAYWDGESVRDPKYSAWSWMDYQKGQAAKEDSILADLRGKLDTLATQVANLGDGLSSRKPMEAGGVLAP